MADDVFKFNGATKSSEISTIEVTPALRELASSVGMPIVDDAKEIERKQMWQMLIKQTVDALPAQKEGDPLIYVATGGGYGANEMLLAAEQKSGRLPERLTAIEGHNYRNLPIFDAEKERVREAIREFLGEEAIKKNPNAVEQTLSAFYSDEVNTQITKSAVIEAFGEKSVAHKSASLYEDTITRAKAAQDAGMTTVLVAGNRDFEKMIKDQGDKIEPYNTARSYHTFATRFKDELVPLFDQIRLYDSDSEPPKLIAEKKGKGQELEIKDPVLYAKFVANQTMDPLDYASPTVRANVIAEEAQKLEEAKKAEQQKPAPEQGKDMSEILPPMPMGAPMPKSSGVTPPGH